MLCFLPPPPAAPHDSGSSTPRPGDSGLIAAVLVSLVAVAALVAPIGWPARSRTPAVMPRRDGGPSTVRRAPPSHLNDLAFAIGGLHRPDAFRASVRAAVRPTAQPVQLGRS